MEVSSYSEIYQQYFGDQDNPNKIRYVLGRLQSPYPYNYGFQVNSTNSTNTVYDGTSFGGDYILGYTLPEDINIDEETQEVSSTIELGPYVFNSDIDITGISYLLVPGKKNKGEEDDDALFEELVRDLEPYVANSTHTFDYVKFSNFKKGIGEVKSEDLGPDNSISGARAYAYLLMLQADAFSDRDWET